VIHPEGDEPGEAAPGSTPPSEQSGPAGHDQADQPGGGPAGGPADEERRYPSTIGGACYLVVLGVGVAAIVVAAIGDWRFGVRLLAGALGGAAACRLVLPQRDAGMLAVRHRLVDVVLLVAVAVALWVLAGDIPDQPGPVVVPG